MENSIYRKLVALVSSYKGKVMLNFAYSWGAAIVIAGALFKLTYLPGANLMIWIGMGTEVLVFFVSAFDLPKKESTAPTATHAGQEHVAPIAQTATPSGILAEAIQQRVPDMTITDKDITDSSNRLKAMNETIQRFNTQLTAITAMYEMQLKTASSQIGTMDNVHEQMKRMATQIEQLNRVYERMLQALNNPKN